MDAKQLRFSSRKYLNDKKISIPDFLPLLDWPIKLRNIRDICDRLMCLHVSVACACGFSRDKGMEWVKQERLENKLTKKELCFLSQGFGNASKVEMQVEAIWLLVWAVHLTSKINFNKECNDSLVKLLPDLKTMEASKVIRTKAKLRTIDEIGEKLDLAYCLHWFIRESDESFNNIHVATYVIEQRRHALEWLVSTEGWDEISLDT